jgi:hypothetical protein
VVHPGRGLSNGRRPLNYQDVILAADMARLGPAAIGFLHLLGSWEESRGDMAALFGTELGPVRLLHVPLLVLAPLQREMVLRRFFAAEAAHLADGGTIDGNHHGLLTTAWATGCGALSADVVAELRALAPAEVRADLIACP